METLECDMASGVCVSLQNTFRDEVDSVCKHDVQMICVIVHAEVLHSDATLPLHVKERVDQIN